MNQILDWRHEDYPKLASATEAGKQYVVWEQPSLATPGRLIYTVSQRTVAGRRIKEHQRATEIADWTVAFFTAQQWAWAQQASA